MRIAIIAPGSRGDVQPYIALGKGLNAAGHNVRLLTHQNFEHFIKSHELEYWPFRGNVQEVAESQEMRELLEKGNYLNIAAFQAKAAKRAAVEWAEDGIAACDGMDLIIAGIGGLYIGISLAEKLKIPLLQAHFIPFTPTKEFLGALFPRTTFNLKSVNYLSHHITRQIMWQGFRVADNVARQDVLGLDPAPFWGPYRSGVVDRMPLLYGFSPSVIPQPTDWGDEIKITGYWFLDTDEEWKPSSDLINFLDSGAKPVYIGFGSMSNRNPEETGKLVIDAIRMSEQRAILLSGWSGLQVNNLPDSVLVVDSIPHSWLFPRVAAVVHHGGAGTTAAGLRAGIPSVVIPFFGDQPFWGARVAELGVGPNPIPRKKLTPERLSQAIQEAVMNDEMCQRASNLGEKIRSEDGVASAVEIIPQVYRTLK
jgi:UDP:flavonoid glycosyltransferase YjiC (YdhE family)